MGGFFFIYEKKICPIEIMKILEYARSVSVPKPVLVHLSNYVCEVLLQH